MTDILNLDVLKSADVRREPYDHLMGSHFLRGEKIPELSRDFPEITMAGFHPADTLPLKGAFRALIAELNGPELSQAMSEKFGIDFSPFPRLITVRKVSAAHEGRIHCDGKSKVATLLVYMNEGWQPADGRLRVLKSEHDFEDYTAEVSPEMGTMFTFLRSDHSWHGHKPFVGERRVVQVAWVRSQADLDRKRNRHTVSSFFKKLFGKGNAGGNEEGY
jgi:hypothetical protein